MKDFIERWNTDSKFKTKVKLGLYTLFVVVVSVFAISNNQTVSTNVTDMDYDNNSNINEQEQMTIKIPENYNYTTNITINEKKYQYTGTKDSEKETITKLSNDITSNYIYQNENYYKEESDTYILTTKEEVYDIVSFNYLRLETINQYLSKSTKENDKYLVYLKDIILGNDSKEYITITIEENKTNIDYTSLMKVFDKSIENYTVEIVIEEKE